MMALGDCNLPAGLPVPGIEQNTPSLSRIKKPPGPEAGGFFLKGTF
jgi:hypothetical protein